MNDRVEALPAGLVCGKGLFPSEGFVKREAVRVYSCFLAHHRRKGLSIIEVTIVLALIGILTSIAVPVLIGSWRYERFTNVVHTLISDFNRARDYAITNNSYCRIIFDEAGGAYHMELYDEDNNLWIPLPESRELPEGVVFSPGGITFENLIATFTPFGSLTAGGEIALEDSYGNRATLNSTLANGQLHIVEE